MPRADFYAGLELDEAVQLFAEHHFEPDTRHISQDEYVLLLEAARALSSTPRRPDEN